MKHLALLAALLLPGAVRQSPSAHAAQSVASRAAADSGASVQQMAPGIYAVIRNEPLGVINESNSVFIVGDRDVIVVDAQSSSARTRETLAAIRRITSKPVSTLINTHWHDDHVVGNHVYAEAFPGLTIIGHADNAEDMRTMGVQFRQSGAKSRTGTIGFLRGLVDKNESFLGGPIDAAERRSHQLSAWLLDEYSNASGDFLPLTPTKPVSDRFTLTQGKRKIEILNLGRGHTRGDLVVHLPAERIVVAGDLVMWPVQFVGSTSYPKDFARTEERIRELRPSIVVPGHGKVLHAAEADAHMALIATMLRSISDQVDAAVARNETLEQTRKSVDISAYRGAMAGESRINTVLFNYYVAGSAVARAYELARSGPGRGFVSPGSTLLPRHR